MVRNILHIDMNCFYVSIETQRRPELRNKPVAVCGNQEERHGIVLTANYNARPFGVKTGMAVWQAKQHCPDLVVLLPDMGEYIRISKIARQRKLRIPICSSAEIAQVAFDLFRAC